MQYRRLIIAAGLKKEDRMWSGCDMQSQTLGHVLYRERTVRKLEINLEGGNKKKQDMWGNAFNANTDNFLNTGPPVQTHINSYSHGSKRDAHVGSGSVIHKLSIETNTEE